MTSTVKIILVAVTTVAVIAVSALVLRLIVGGNEDTWLCQGNQWVKHGNPSAQIPNTPCGTAKTPAEGQESQQETTTQASSSAVPPLTEESFVRIFFSLINAKQIPDAVAMLDSKLVPNDSARQAWGVQFASWGQVTVEEVKPFTNPELTAGADVYQVTFTTASGEDTRWLTIIKDAAGQFKIGSIATGP